MEWLNFTNSISFFVYWIWIESRTGQHLLRFASKQILKKLRKFVCIFEKKKTKCNEKMVSPLWNTKINVAFGQWKASQLYSFFLLFIYFLWFGVILSICLFASVEPTTAVFFFGEHTPFFFFFVGFFLLHLYFG